MQTFRKLIRDNIPEIMKQEGKTPRVRVLDEQEYKEALERKLLEEVQEMRQGADKKIEIADIYEVLEALMRAHRFSEEEIRRLQDEKRAARGGFEKRLFLEGME